MSHAPHLAGTSRAMGKVLAQISQVAPTEATVLISGESGTGKSLAARAIHDASSRADGPFISVNCATIPSELFESELFGHRTGAFAGAGADRSGRFEEASGGTLVLDDIGTLHPELQSKLLRVLDTREYEVLGDSATLRSDVRVIAATNEDLAARVRAGTFRADLFYRLEVFPLQLPPLRARTDDIPVIAASILATRGESRLPQPLAPELCTVLADHTWPGNVRELKNVLERLDILAAPGVNLAELAREVLGLPGGQDAPLPRGDELNMRRNLDALGRKLLLDALARSGGRKKEASAYLGIDARNLGYYLRKHGVRHVE